MIKIRSNLLSSVVQALVLPLAFVFVLTIEMVNSVFLKMIKIRSNLLSSVVQALVLPLAFVFVLTIEMVNSVFLLIYQFMKKEWKAIQA